MKQGVFLPCRVKHLSDDHSYYRPSSTYERKRQPIGGCVVNTDIGVLSLVIVKQGDADVPGLIDNVLPKRLSLCTGEEAQHLNYWNDRGASAEITTINP